jgi:hypothetical protein
MTYLRIQLFGRFTPMGMFALYSCDDKSVVDWESIADFKVVNILRNEFVDFSEIHSHIVILEKQMT